MKVRRTLTIVLSAITLCLVLLALGRCTDALRSRRAVRDMAKALTGVLEERGEKGLLEMAGADPDKLFYEYEGVESYTGDKRAWDYSAMERLNMSVYETVSPSVVRIESFMGLTKRGDGAGVVYSEDGYIITDRHVISGGETFTVYFRDGLSSSASLTGIDPVSDIAVLKTEAVGLKAIRTGDSRDTAVGEEVYAIGHPFGYDWSLSKGLLSGKDRLVTPPKGAPIPGMLQTDAAINPGNSGGPLISSSGAMIGLVSSIYSPSGYNEGIAFALPAEQVVKVADDLIASGSIEHGWLDITVLEVNPVIADYASLPVNCGILVSKTIADGEAEKAGIRGGSRKAQYGNNAIYLGGDIITSIDGIPVRSFTDYASVLFSLRAGDTVDLGILRGNRELVVKDVALIGQTEENSRWLIQ